MNNLFGFHFTSGGNDGTTLGTRSDGIELLLDRFATSHRDGASQTGPQFHIGPNVIDKSFHILVGNVTYGQANHPVSHFLFNGHFIYPPCTGWMNYDFLSSSPTPQNPGFDTDHSMNSYLQDRLGKAHAERQQHVD
jgi:hypothetical protein